MLRKRQYFTQPLSFVFHLSNLLLAQKVFTQPFSFRCHPPPPPPAINKNQSLIKNYTPFEVHGQYQARRSIYNPVSQCSSSSF